VRAVSWSPRRELAGRLPGLLREIVADVKLLIRIRLAIAFGSRAHCNLAIDALIIRDEARASRCRS
jgi:hypothetical protein